MKRLCMLFLVVLAIAIQGWAKDKELLVRVTNPLQLDRPREMIVLNWDHLKSKMPRINADGLVVQDSKSGAEITYQPIDVDQDGTVDELIFQSDFNAGETKSFMIVQSKKAKKPIQSLTDARFVTPREDIAWENDRVAYRIYGPALAKEVNNGFDVWTKRVRYLIVEKWYKGEEATGSAKISYHEDHGEGADFFNVGRSLGAGSCALYKGDSLYQPGVFATYKIIATGPIRTMFEVTYKPVQFDGKSISEIKRVTLDAGNNLNKVEVTYQCDSASGTVPFAAGIVKRTGVTGYTDKENRWVSLWGLTTDKEEQGALGTGIVMTEEAFKEIKEDTTLLLIIGNVELGKMATYYAGAGWTRSGDFKNAEDWNIYLKESSLRINNPLKIEVAVEK